MTLPILLGLSALILVAAGIVVARARAKRRREEEERAWRSSMPEHRVSGSRLGGGYN